MKLRSLIAAAGVFALVACGSLNDVTSSVRDKMTAREAPKVRSFPASQRATFDAVRTAATNMGYRVVRGGAAQGQLEAISGVGPGETHGSARQISMHVTLAPNLEESATEVSLRLTEIIESDSSNRAGQATKTPLRDTPLYDSFFRRVGEALGVSPEPVGSQR